LFNLNIGVLVMLVNADFDPKCSRNRLVAELYPEPVLELMAFRN